MHKIAVVNGLRGLAILGVLFQHTGCDWARAALDGDWAVLRPLVTNGWTGVNLFFILSGFVLFLPYAAGERRMAAWADARRFYARRFLRLMPLYYAAAAVLLLLAAPRLAPAAFAGLAADLATVRFVLLPHHFSVPLNYPLWSIGVEILFSLGFPLAVLAAGRVGLPRLLAVALLGALAMRVAGRIWDPHPLGPNFIADNIFGRIDEFVLGMALARAHVAGRIPPWARGLLWPGLAFVLLAWAGFYRCQYRGLTMLAMAPLNNVLDLGFAAVLAAALAHPREGHALLRFAPLQVLGMMCYSLYIWHVPVLEAAWPAQGLAVALGLLLLLAGFSYRFVEFRQAADWRALFLLRRP